MKVIDHRTETESETRKPYTVYSIQITFRIDRQTTASNGAQSKQSSLGGGNMILPQSETHRAIIEKRYSDFYKLKQHLKHRFAGFYKRNRANFAIPKRYFDARRNLEESTVMERSLCFEMFLSHVLADEPLRVQLFSDPTIAGFLTERLQCSVHSDLRSRKFAQALFHLRSLYAIALFAYRTDAHPLSFASLLALVVAFVHADPLALSPRNLSDLRADLASQNAAFQSDSSANSDNSSNAANDNESDTRHFLVSIALGYAQRAWRVLEVSSASKTAANAGVTLRYAVYRDALADAIDWLYLQTTYAHSAHSQLFLRSSRSPNISRLLETVIRDNLP